MGKQPRPLYRAPQSGPRTQPTTLHKRNAQLSAIPFDRTVRTRVPASWIPHFKTAARAFGCTVSEYIREALAEALVNDGFAPRDQDEPRDQTASELYDVVNGERQWCLVNDAGAILTGPQWFAEKPDTLALAIALADGNRWLPVVNLDSKPFDRRQHWRLDPELRVESDRVVRFYPVVRKSLEHA